MTQFFFSSEKEQKSEMWKHYLKVEDFLMTLLLSQGKNVFWVIVSKNIDCKYNSLVHACINVSNKKLNLIFE